MSYKISDKEIEKLRAFFNKILELSEMVIDVSCRQLEGVAVMVRSLGRRVPTNWVLKQVRFKSKFDYDPEIFALPEDYLVLRLRSKGDCALVKNGGP